MSSCTLTDQLFHATRRSQTKFTMKNLWIIPLFLMLIAVNCPGQTPDTCTVHCTTNYLHVSNDRLASRDIQSNDLTIQQRMFISYYPCPAQSVIHIHLLGTSAYPNTSVVCFLLNDLGLEVQDLSMLANQDKTPDYSQFDLNVSSLPSGIYIIKYSMFGFSFARSFMVLH